MKQFYYFNQIKEKKLRDNPEFIWDMYHTSSLNPYELDDDKHTIQVKCLLGYSTQYLYVVVKTTQKKLIARDRAYQNGDGFHFVLAKPNENHLPTDEFYVIGISPLDESKFNRFIWYYNVDLTMIVLKQSMVKVKTIKDNSYITVMIPWGEIEPIKGLLYKQYGFNISYIQATLKGCNVYMLKPDEYIQSEQSLREYDLYDFEEPKEIKQFSYQVDLNRRHGGKDDEIVVEFGIISPFEQEIKLLLKHDNNYILDKSIMIEKGFKRIKLKLDISSLSKGNHKLCVQLKEKDNIYHN